MYVLGLMRPLPIVENGSVSARSKTTHCIFRIMEIDKISIAEYQTQVHVGKLSLNLELKPI